MPLHQTVNVAREAQGRGEDREVPDTMEYGIFRRPIMRLGTNRDKLGQAQLRQHGAARCEERNCPTPYIAR